MAFGAAAAAEAAGLQGKYWEMHDLIYANQLSLANEMLLEAAKELNLDVNQFTQDIESESIRKKIEHDFETGATSGVNGTPTFFINGKRFNGNAADLYQLIAENVSN